MRRRLGLALQYVAIVVLVLYLLDWAIFVMRHARGHGTATVVVEQYLATPLKGEKVEYDYMGEAQVTCAEALFPHGSYPVCWWVRRHKNKWE